MKLDSVVRSAATSSSGTPSNLRNGEHEAADWLACLMPQMSDPAVRQPAPVPATQGASEAWHAVLHGLVETPVESESSDVSDASSLDPEVSSTGRSLPNARASSAAEGAPLWGLVATSIESMPTETTVRSSSDLGQNVERELDGDLEPSSDSIEASNAGPTASLAALPGMFALQAAPSASLDAPRNRDESSARADSAPIDPRMQRSTADELSRATARIEAPEQNTPSSVASSATTLTATSAEDRSNAASALTSRAPSNGRVSDNDLPSAPTTTGPGLSSELSAESERSNVTLSREVVSVSSRRSANARSSSRESSDSGNSVERASVHEDSSLAALDVSGPEPLSSFVAPTLLNSSTEVASSSNAQPLVDTLADAILAEADSEHVQKGMVRFDVRGSDQAVVRLEHADLGTVSIHVRARSGDIDVRMIGATVSTAIALRSVEDDLRASLRARGRELKSMRVTTRRASREREEEELS